jgi:hypothetical protein
MLGTPPEEPSSLQQDLQLLVSVQTLLVAALLRRCSTSGIAGPRQLSKYR